MHPSRNDHRSQGGRKAGLSAYALAATLLAGAITSGCGPSAQTAPSSKTLNVAVLYGSAPVTYRSEETGKLTGFLYEIMMELGPRAGVQFNFVPTSFESTIIGVQSGKFDIAAGPELTAPRLQVVDMVPVYADTNTFAVKQTSKKRFTSDWMSLCGSRIAIVSGSSPRAQLAATSEKCQAAGKRPINIVALPSDSVGALAVQGDKVDAVVVANWTPPPPDSQFSGPTFSAAQSGFALRKGSPWGPKLTAALNDMIADGSYARILDKYDVSPVALKQSHLNGRP